MKTSPWLKTAKSFILKGRRHDEGDHKQKEGVRFKGFHSVTVIFLKLKLLFETEEPKALKFSDFGLFVEKNKQTLYLLFEDGDMCFF